MFNSNGNKPKSYKIYVVKSLLNRRVLNSTLGLEGVIIETYSTGINDFVYVPISEAKRAIERLGNGHYIATDNPEIAEKYNIRLYDTNARLTNKTRNFVEQRH